MVGAVIRTPGGRRALMRSSESREETLAARCLAMSPARKSFLLDRANMSDPIQKEGFSS